MKKLLLKAKKMVIMFSVDNFIAFYHNYIIYELNSFNDSKNKNKKESNPDISFYLEFIFAVARSLYLRLT